jgi:hypothetical protein
MTPAINSAEKNDVFPIREWVVVRAITRMQSDRRRIIFGLRIQAMVSLRNSFQEAARRSESPAISKPMPMASVMFSMPAKWLRLGYVPLAERHG